MTEELAVSPWDETQQGDSARAGEPPVLVCETTTEGEESMKGIITEIERFALKDGPGIRTTVFSRGATWRANGAITRKRCRFGHS